MIEIIIIFWIKEIQNWIHSNFLDIIFFFSSLTFFLILVKKSNFQTKNILFWLLTVWIWIWQTLQCHSHHHSVGTHFREFKRNQEWPKRRLNQYVYTFIIHHSMIESGLFGNYTYPIIQKEFSIYVVDPILISFNYTNCQLFKAKFVYPLKLWITRFLQSFITILLTNFLTFSCNFYFW